MQILKDEFPVWIVSTTEHCQRNHCNICQRNQPTSSQKIGQPWSVIGRQNQCPSTASLYQIPGRDKRWAGWGAKNSCCDLLLFPSYPNKPMISLGVKAPLVLSKGTTLQAVTSWRQFCSPQKIKLLMTMELLPSDISLTEFQAWPNLHSRHVKALQWWQWQVINIDKKLHFKFFLINNSKVFAYFLSDHTFLVPHRESLVTERFNFSSKGKGVAADSPLHRCVLVPAGVSQSSAFPSRTDSLKSCLYVQWDTLIHKRCHFITESDADVAMGVLTFFRNQKFLYSLSAWKVMTVVCRNGKGDQFCF